MILFLTHLLTTGDAFSNESPWLNKPEVPTLNTNTETIEHTPPVYWATKAAVAVPANASEDVMTIGPAMGIFMDKNNAMGMRIIYMDSPPENPLAEYTPKVSMAWGPVVDWQYLFQPNSGFSFYTQASVGFVYGEPDNANENNVVLPIIEGGFGARLSRRTSKGGRFFFSPELGFVPGAVAPYMSASFGYIAPARTERY